MKKSNIRSIRFSDDLAKLIDRQEGRTFTEKFENLIARCVWELPAKEEKLEQLDQRIVEKQRQLQRMSEQAGELRATLSDLLPKVTQLEDAIHQAVKKWDV